MMDSRSSLIRYLLSPNFGAEDRAVNKHNSWNLLSSVHIRCKFIVFQVGAMGKNKQSKAEAHWENA